MYSIVLLYKSLMMVIQNNVDAIVKDEIKLQT